MKINVHLTRKEYGDALDFLAKIEINQIKKTKYNAVVNFWAVFFYMPAGLILGLIAADGIKFAFLYIFSIACLFWYGKVCRKLYRKYWEKLPQKPESLFGPKEYELTESGLKSRWSYGTSETSWSAVQRIVRLKDITLFVVDDCSVHVFPERCFSNSLEHEQFCEKSQVFIKSLS